MMKRIGIRKKVILTATFLVISSLTLLGAALSVIIFISQEQQLLTLQDEVINHAVNGIYRDIHEIETLLNITADSADLTNLNSRDQFNVLSQILTGKDVKHHDILDELTLLNGKGRELARVSRTIVYTTSDLGERSQEDVFVIPKKSGEIYYGPLTFDKTTHEPRIMMSLPVSDIRSGAVNGVLLGNIRLNKVWENVSERSFEESGIVFLTDLEGKIAAHPDPSVIYRNTFYKAKKSRGIQTGLEGKKVLLVSREFQMGNQTFTVYASLPLGRVLSLSLHTISITALFLLVFVFFSIVISFIVVQRIVRPIESLADTARTISAGKISFPGRIEGNDEISDLSNAFNIMTSNLMDSINSLKKQMAERQQAEEKIIQQNRLMNSILNSLTHPFYVIDANNYTIKLANSAAQFGKLTGDSTCYALTHQREEPCDSAEHPCVIKKIKKTGGPVAVEHIHYDKDGGPLISEVHGYPIFDSNGNIAQVIEYNLDITDRKKSEEKIRASLQEKEVLLKEIHHRVKNNMQIISSLLRLQSMQMAEPGYIEMLRETQNRIKSMSLIHEKLYKSEDLAYIDLGDYIKNLTHDIFLFYRIDTGKVALKIEAEKILLGIDTAIPCGLIINELVSNSLKYAFPATRPAGKHSAKPGGGKGEIRIRLRKTPEGEFLLNVSDNGIGIPENIDIRKTETLGLRLVTTLSEDQLQGKIELNRTGGTEFRIRFKEVKYEKRI